MSVASPSARTRADDTAGEVVVTNARLVLPDEAVLGTLVIRDGRIVDVSRSRTGAHRAIDLAGDLLVPGLVDLHSDNLERHMMPRTRVTWPPVAAVIDHDMLVLGAGITTMLDCVALAGVKYGIDRPTIAGPMVEALDTATRLGLLRVEHLIHLRCEVPEPGMADRVIALADAPAVRLVSLMDHTPGQRQFGSADAWKSRVRDREDWTEAELEARVQAMVETAQRHASENRTKVAALARRRGLALASHDDADAEHVREAAELGATIAEFPINATAATEARRQGLHIVMGAPNLVRGQSHSGNMATRDAARADLLDILASDYVPGSLLKAALLLTRDPVGWDLPRALATVTAAPARAVGLHDRGTIAVGQRADLVRVGVVAELPVVRTVWRAGVQIL